MRSAVIVFPGSNCDRDVPVLGVCNGFRVQTEAGQLPSALIGMAARQARRFRQHGSSLGSVS